MPLDAVAERGGPIPVLRLIGEVDVSTVDLLRQRIQELFDQGASSIAFDLTQVAFIDSMGIGALLGAKRRAAEREGEVYLLEPSGVLQRLLAVLSMERMFLICSVAEFRRRFPSDSTEPAPRTPKATRSNGR